MEHRFNLFVILLKRRGVNEFSQDIRLPLAVFYFEAAA